MSRILRGSAVVSVMSLFAAFTSYFVRVILARQLTLEEYGLFFAIFTLINFTYFLKDFGLQQASAKYIAEFRVHNRYDKIKAVIKFMTCFQFIIGSILVIIFYASADLLATYYFQNPMASWLLRIMIFHIIFGIVIKVYKATFQGFQKMRYFSLLEFLRIFSVLVMILLFLSKYGIKSAAIAYTIAPLFVGVLLFKKFLKYYPSKETASSSDGLYLQMIWFGLPVMLTAMGGEIISFFDTLILTYFRPLAEVGIYQVVLPTTVATLLLGRSVAVTIFPMVSEYWAKKDYDKIKKGIKLFYKVSPLLIIPLIFSYILAGPFLRIFFGPEFLPGLSAMRILFTGVFIYFIGMINYHVLAGIGYPGDNAKILISGGAVNIIFNFILIPSYGMIGAAIATLISYIWVTGYSTYKIKRRVFDVQTI